MTLHMLRAPVLRLINLHPRTLATTASMSTSSSLPAAQRHLERAVTQLTPLELADRSWDNVGWMVACPSARKIDGKQRVLLCNDLTTSVVDEAIEQSQTSLILTYHPPIFSGLKSLTPQGSALQHSLLRCIQAGISVFTVHTAADNVQGGTNDFLASAFGPGHGSVNVETITSAVNPPPGHEQAGTGRRVTLTEGIERSTVVASVKRLLGREYLQAAWSDKGADTIKTIAICAGSGSSVLKNEKVDLVLTGELGHHDILAFNARGVHCLLCTHSATERPWLHEFAPRLQKTMNELGESEGAEYEVGVSARDREPLETV